MMTTRVLYLSSYFVRVDTKMKKSSELDTTTMAKILREIPLFLHRKIAKYSNVTFFSKLRYSIYVLFQIYILNRIEAS